MNRDEAPIGLKAHTPTNLCEGCYFYAEKEKICTAPIRMWHCTEAHRKDNCDVIFKLEEKPNEQGK